jgi:hypothetical protein
MIHFDRFCAALGFLVLMISLIVGSGFLFGIKPMFPCVYKTYAAWVTVTREGVCEL